MPNRLAVLKRIETRLCVQPAQSSASSTYSAMTAGSAPTNSSSRELPDVDGGPGTAAGRLIQFGKLQLRDPDRILIGHAHRHQPRDFGKHGVVDAVLADEPPQPVDVKLGVAGALIVDQEMDGIAGHRHHRLRQPFGQKRRRVVILADEIGEQITQRRQDTAV